MNFNLVLFAAKLSVGTMSECVLEENSYNSDTEFLPPPPSDWTSSLNEELSEDVKYQISYQSIQNLDR